MPVSTSVKYFHSAMSGSPVLNGTAGSLIAVLDACLVNGFNLKSVDALTVASGVATATISTGVGAFEADTVALIDGASPSGLNGEKRIISTTPNTNTITFDATGIADQTATGTITAKLASAEWEKQFSGTNLAAYRSGDVTSTRAVLRVNDAAAQNARVVGYESMSGISTGTKPFPTSAQQSGGLWWPKADDTSATPRCWTLIADSKTFYLHMHTLAGGAGESGSIVAFGDFLSYKSGDAYCNLISGFSSDVSASSYYQVQDFSSAVETRFFVSRAYTALGTSIAGFCAVESYGQGGGFSGQIGTLSTPFYPNGADNSLILSRKIIYETGSLRGVARGALFAVQPCKDAFNWRDKIDGQGVYAGKKIIAIKGAAPSGTWGADGVMFFDIVGPW